MNIISWNVNGVRAIEKKGFFDWLNKESPDICCLQETKAHPEQLNDKILNPAGYTSFWSSAEKKGYSGVAIYSKQQPKSVKQGFGLAKFDSEGRTLVAEYDDFILFNVYFPNGGRDCKRLEYKMEFYQEFQKTLVKLKKKQKNIIVCGDVNTAHQAIDLARPKANEKNTGFLPEERAWVTDFLSCGFIDTFRVFESETNHYTWWDYKTRARERNVGWRIDYFFISEALKSKLKTATIYHKIMGSDHCPIGITLK